MDCLVCGKRVEREWSVYCDEHRPVTPPPDQTDEVDEMLYNMACWVRTIVEVSDTMADEHRRQVEDLLVGLRTTREMYHAQKDR